MIFEIKRLKLFKIEKRRHKPISFFREDSILQNIVFEKGNVSEHSVIENVF